MRLIAIALLLAGFALPGFATAQEPPGRVGRLAYVAGEVSLYQDPEIGWDQAFVNSPITSENSLWTEPGAHAEMRLSGMAVRLGEASQLDIARLDDAQFDAFLVQGSAAIRVRWLDAGQSFDFSTPHGRFHVQGVGRYRIDVDPARDETVFTVFSGTASLAAANGDVRIEGGSALRIFGGPSPSYDREPARTTAVDRFAQERDNDWVETTSTRYVSPYMTGYEELDRFGQWVDDPGYGPLWYPTRVESDWLPYREGHWAWVRPWGWTWVGDEPWGYAPYHYGRWVYARDRWCWSPGQRVDRPVWAPALVAWVGGSSFSVSVQGRSAPAVGWYPLAPWERYQPWYHASDRYTTRVNAAVRSEPPREWRERYARDARGTEWRTFNRDRAATVVRRDALGDRRDVRREVLPVNRDVIRQATVVSPAAVATREQWVRQRTESRRDTGGHRAGPPAAAQQSQPPSQQPQGRSTGTQPAPGTAPFTPVPAQTNPAARGAAPAARGENAAGRGDNHPRYERERHVPAPQPATAARPGATQPAPQPAPAGTATPAQAPVNPAARRPEADRGRQSQEQQRQQQEAQRQQQEAQRQSQERAAREAAQQQQRQQQDAQRQQQEAQRQTQERAAREAAQQQQQRQQQEQQRQQQEAQRQTQERAAREAAQQQQRQQQEAQRQTQERAAREAAQQQQRQQQEAQRQQQAQQRQQQEAQRQQQEAQHQQQQAQQRAAEAQQRAAEQQRQAQERAAREAQQRAQPPQAKPAPAPQAQPAPPPPPPKNEDRGKGREDNQDRGKGPDR